MSLPFSHFRAFVGFREPNSSFKRYNNNMYLFFRAWLRFQDEQESPERGEFLKTTTSSRILYSDMSVKIFNLGEPGYFPSLED